MLNAITPNTFYNARPLTFCRNRQNLPQANSSVLASQKSSHDCEILGRKTVNRITGLFNKKFVDQANEVLSKIDRPTPEYVYAIAGTGRVFSQNKEVEINTEDEIIQELANSKRPHIFIMNHDNQTADPQMLGFFNTLLNEEYIISGQAAACPRPRIILNEDILTTMQPKMRNIFEKLGSIGIDASLIGGNKVANGKKMVQIMKEYEKGESNIYIFPEGKNCAYKNWTLEEKFQPGIASMISRMISKGDVSVVPLGFAYNKSDKNLSSIEIGKPIVFEKNKNSDKDEIFNTLCSALSETVAKAKTKVPQKSLGEKVIYV
ncbi:1-acyl-sn-glycerol-3-phosphate acyltransferase [bacterium]|nr:1-acyl-sn-glycerol-3-phosphate acyltransferase [bacterium]